MRRMCSVIELATVETGVDFPLCSECSMDVLGELNAEMYDIDMEIDAYEQELALMSHPYFTEATHERDIAKMAFSLEQCERDIRTTEAEILQLSEKERSLSAKGIELMVSKSEYWRTFEIHAADREAMLENMISAHNRLTHAKKWLDLVRSSHVVNDAFHVSLDLHLATINGLRVGRLPSAPVEWPEISAALGFTLQMLHEIALRASFAFTKYRIVVDGSFSGLYKLPNGGFMALHSDSDISLVRLVQFQGVNAAMSALVECVSELADFLRTLDGSFYLPFTISKDLVGGVSIKRAWNSSGATWSTALRSLMANMKFILAWEAKQGLCV
jgi:beclin 1